MNERNMRIVIWKWDGNKYEEMKEVPEEYVKITAFEMKENFMYIWCE